MSTLKKSKGIGSNGLEVVFEIHEIRILFQELKITAFIDVYELAPNGNRIQPSGSNLRTLFIVNDTGRKERRADNVFNAKKQVYEPGPIVISAIEPTLLFDKMAENKMQDLLPFIFDALDKLPVDFTAETLINRLT